MSFTEYRKKKKKQAGVCNETPTTAFNMFILWASERRFNFQVAQDLKYFYRELFTWFATLFCSLGRITLLEATFAVLLVSFVSGNDVNSFLKASEQQT